MSHAGQRCLDQSSVALPYSSRPVHRCGYDKRAFWAELSRANPIGVASQESRSRMRPGIPDPDRSVIRRRRDAFAVRAVDCATDPGFVTEQRGDTHARARIPNSHSLVFSHWTKTLDNLEQQLKRLKLPFVRIDGSLSLEQRRILVTRFSENPKIQIMLLSYGSGSVGYSHLQSS